VNTNIPPPDPNESVGMQPVGETRLTAPTAVFVMGAPSPQTDRTSNDLLELRPGLLIVVESE
jgi:hypothetical protein